MPGRFHDTRLFSLPVLVLLASSLVVHLLAFGKPDIEFYPPFAPVQVEWHQGVALPFHSASQAVELMAVHQQFAGAGWVRTDMGRCGRKRRYVGAQEPCLAVA